MKLDAIFFALADPTRRAILECLAQGELFVMDMAEPFAIEGLANWWTRDTKAQAEKGSIGAFAMCS